MYVKSVYCRPPSYPAPCALSHATVFSGCHITSVDGRILAGLSPDWEAETHQPNNNPRSLHTEGRCNAISGAV